MKPSEMHTIYGEACRMAANRPVPDQAQEKLWYRLMSGFDGDDVREGLVLWYKAESFLPMPADLKPLSEQARRERITKSAIKTVLARWSCPDCGIPRSGWIPLDDHASRRCQGIPTDKRTDTNRFGQRICGALMSEVFREG